MSKYTTEVRFICEEKAGLDHSKGYTKIDEIVEQARTKIFPSFPIFDEAYRPVLEKKILKHFYTREICEETFGLWQLRLDNRMNEIMPYYNQLYKSELLEFNPLYDVDVTTSRDKQGTSSGLTSSSETESGSKVKTENITGNDSITDDSTSFKEGKENGSESESATKGITSNDKATNGETTTTTGNNVTSVGATNKGSSDEDDLKWDYYSDTPQGTVGNIDNLTYLTNARKNTDKENIKTENVENSNTVEVGDETVTKSIDGTVLNMKSENGFKENEQEKTTSENSVSTNINEKEHSENRNAAENNDVEKSKNTNNTINNIEDYFEHVVGKRGSMTYSKMLNEFRDTFLNIDMMIINDLSDLFFYLW